MEEGPSDVTVGQNPSRLTLGRFLEDVTARYGSRAAVAFEGGRWTFAQVHAQAVRLARGLVGAGVSKGARVALLMSNRPEWITSAYAVGMLGGVLVPVNTFATRDERDHILRHSDASVLLLQPSLLRHGYLEELLAAHPEIRSATPGAVRSRSLPQLRSVFVLSDEGPSGGGVQGWKELEALGEDVPEELIHELCSEVHPSDDAVIIYTSGSTALPKGVAHRQRTPVIQAYRFAEQFRLEPTDRVWSAQPFFWSAGMAMTLGGTFAAGAMLILQEHFEPGQALELLERERATLAHAWAHQHMALGEHPSARKRDLSSLRVVTPTSPLFELAGLKEDRWDPGASYGLSETFTICSCIPADSPLELRERTSGRPLPGVQIRIADPETGAPLPVGEHGEICVKGVTLMSGYHKVSPEEVFDSDGYFHTKDGGSLDSDGYLHWTGRLGDLIKTGGANVSPREIELALDDNHELHAAQAVGVPHPTLGEVIIVCAVSAEGAHPTEEGVREFLRGKLASYKLPRRTFFFTPDQLELTGNQKIRLEPLRQAALARLEAEGALIAGHRYEPPSEN